MKKAVLIVACILTVFLVACSNGGIKRQNDVNADHSGVGISAGQNQTASSSGANSFGDTQAASQSKELQEILNNLSNVGNSAGGLDKASSSDLNIPNP